MAADGSGDPRGLYMSLDDIIEENHKEKKKTQSKSSQGETFHGGRSRGRGNRGGGRGRGFGRAGRSNQQQQVQQQQQQFLNNSAQARNVRVIVQNQVPNIEYRQVSQNGIAQSRPLVVIKIIVTSASTDDHLGVQFQDCYRDDYGNVIFTYKGAELVRVSISTKSWYPRQLLG